MAPAHRHVNFGRCNRSERCAAAPGALPAPARPQPPVPAPAAASLPPPPQNPVRRLPREGGGGQPKTLSSPSPVPPLLPSPSPIRVTADNPVTANGSSLLAAKVTRKPSPRRLPLLPSQDRVKTPSKVRGTLTVALPAPASSQHISSRGSLIIIIVINNNYFVPPSALA